MNGSLIDQMFMPCGRIEASRRLHDLLASYDADLSELESNPTHYTVADYNLRFKAIQSNRYQTLKAIEDLHR